MASEFSAEGGKEIAITVTPGESGVLQVIVDGDKIFDKKEEGNETPTLTRVKEMRAVIKERLAEGVAAD
jgi:predicted Rdx family selenoprotein